jgi:hypothetical protein
MSVATAIARPQVPLSDEEIVTRVLAGETALFEILMRRHNQQVYRAARAILRDEGEAEDVLQQAYVNAYAHLAQFDRRARFSTWLTRSTKPSDAPGAAAATRHSTPARRWSP